VVAELKARLRNGIERNSLDKDFLDLFADQPVRINPLLFVLEGNARQNPTAAIARQQLDEGIAKLRSALPAAILIAADEGGLKGALGLVHDSNPGMMRGQDFLLRLNPKLMSPIGKKDIQSNWDNVLVTAKNCGIPKRSLVVIAALSAVIMPNGSSPAKRLLKFDRNYTRGDAYNALADLRSLQILMYLFAMYPDQRLMLCTADKDLALFWVGLRARDFAFSEGRVTLDMSPTDLLPGITDVRWQSFIGTS
jgi:hypothetical protein